MRLPDYAQIYPHPRVPARVPWPLSPVQLTWVHPRPPTCSAIRASAAGELPGCWYTLGEVNACPRNRAPPISVRLTLLYPCSQGVARE